MLIIHYEGLIFNETVLLKIVNCRLVDLWFTKKIIVSASLSSGNL